MIYSFEEFQTYLMSEVKKIAIKQGWGKKYETSIQEETATLIPSKMMEEFEIVNSKNKNDNLTIEVIEEKTTFNVADIKRLNEEFKRMKELVDFRNPLLNEKNIK